jgi:nucleoside-diphosphate-sugar epimerase
VKDTCKGFYEIANCEKAIGKEINIASNFEISMRDTLEMIAKIMGSDVKFVEDQDRIRPKDSEVFRLWGDNSLINSLTGFMPEYDIRKGLEITCEWFKNPENLSRYKSGLYNV